ncbi:ankyrin repeat domain-containing protein [Archangium violaceum]|nr:ankyrin repeat domain-containing protein [Archangium violaceum]
MKKVDGLLDEMPPQVDEAIPLLRQVVEAEPDRLMALHSLNWALDVSRRAEPERWARELKTEHWRVRDRVLVLTRGTRSGGRLSDAQRARSLALSQWAEEVVRGRPTGAQLDEVEAALEEARALRDIPDHARARRGLEAWRALRQGNPKEGYEALLAQVEETPELRVIDVDDDDASCFSGLQGAFSDEGFIAWLRARKPANRPKGKQAKALDAGLLLAAGMDTAPFFGPDAGANGRLGRVLALRALGANLETLDEDRRGLLHLAAMVDDAALVKELLALGLSASAVDEEKATALHLAAEHGGVACIPLLAKGGVPVDALDKDGRSALFNAQRPDVARALIDAGANPNAGKGWTPLHQQVRFKDRGPVIEVLLEAGADATRKDSAGRTPAEEALDHENPHLAGLLGAKPPSGGAGRLDIQPLLDTLARKKTSIIKSWYFEDKDVADVERVLKGLVLKGATSWDEAAAALRKERPWTAMAVVGLVRDVLPPEEPATSFSKAPRFVRGNLTLEGSVQLTGPLLVTGNLTVEGVLRNVGPEGLLVVGGSLRAAGVDTDAELVVGGDLETQVVWCHHDDPSLRVGGVVKADVLIEDEQDVQAKVEARHHFKNGHFDAEAEVLEDIFVRGAFASQVLERDKLFNLLRKGKPALV